MGPSCRNSLYLVYLTGLAGINMPDTFNSLSNGDATLQQQEISLALSPEVKDGTTSVEYVEPTETFACSEEL